MCSRHTSHGRTVDAVAWHHNPSHTVEFSRNRRPDHSSWNSHSSRSRPGVVRSFVFVFPVLLAPELISSSAFHPITALQGHSLGFCFVLT